MQERLLLLRDELKQIEVHTVAIEELIPNLRAAAEGRKYDHVINAPACTAHLQEKKEEMRRLLSAYELAVNITITEPIMDNPRWTFINAMFFCCSLYTAIGFGGR